MEKYKSTLDEEIICVSYNDTKDLPIDLHTNKYRYIKYEIEEVLKRQDDIEYMITDSKTTCNLLKEVERLEKENEKLKKEKSFLKEEVEEGHEIIGDYFKENTRLNNIIKEVREYINMKEVTITYRELGLLPMRVNEEVLEMLQGDDNNE